MKLREFQLPHCFSGKKGLVMVEVSNAVGMCAQKCSSCDCLNRIIQGCTALGIKIPPYNTKRRYASPIFTMNENQLRELREEIKKIPEPKVW